jgi:hypothetical protein
MTRKTNLSEYIAEDAEDEIKDLVFIMNKDYFTRAFLRTIESWPRTTGFIYIDEVTSENSDIHVFVIDHGMGKRWSSYFENLFNHSLNGLGYKSIGFDMADNSVAFKVDLSN